MPTPEEMRAASEAAAHADKLKAQQERRRIAKKKRERLAKNMSYKDGFIKTVEWHMAQAGSRTNVRVKVDTNPSWSNRAEWEPTLQAVVDHFVAEGFKAWYKIENQMEWYGDGAGPGEDWYFITVDWTPRCMI